MAARYLIALILAYPLALRGADDPILVPNPHPNHYVLMLDSSGSMVNLQADREIYRRVLLSKIQPALESQGFGKEIPPMMPGVDSLTVLHFGLGDATIPARSWEQLRNIDISEEFISTANASDLSAKVPLKRIKTPPAHWLDGVFPDKPAELTGLSLARYFGLWSIRETAPQAEANRTFVIIVDDEEVNDKTPWEERRWLFENMLPSARPKTEAILAYIRQNYSFGPEDAPVWEDQVVSRKKVVFVTAYVVTPSADRAWIGRQRKLARMITPLWKWEAGNRASVNIALNPAFGRALPEARNVDWTVVFDSSSLHREVTTAYHGLDHIQLTNVKSPACGELPEELRITAVIPQPPQLDQILGLRRFSLELVQESELPVPTACTAAGHVTRWTFWTGTLLASGFLGYCAVFGFVRTHLRVELPGKICSYAVPRMGVREGWTPVSPKPNMSALAVRLPHPLWQRLLYRGARLTVRNSDGFAVRFHSGLAAQDTFVLPSPLMRVVALWDGVPGQSTHIQLEFRHGAQQGAVTLRYPEGVNR